MADRKRPIVGIIGGTGLGDVLLAEAGGERIDVTTPFGPPSCDPIVTEWEGVPVAFLMRHGVGHVFGPTNVPYRANIWALKSLGVSAILASGATGSLREDIEPGHLVVCDQVIDRTSKRPTTFFDEGVAVHVELAEPFCPILRELLGQAGEHVDTTVHHAGTYVCMEGPQFSTRAESQMHRQWGGDLIGMTAMPEAKLAREAGLCYALIALPTDYDCWRPVESGRPHDELLQAILANLKRATDNAIELFRVALGLITQPLKPCPCRDALELAVWTEKAKIDPDVKARLDALVGDRLTDRNSGGDGVV